MQRDATPRVLTASLPPQAFASMDPSQSPLSCSSSSSSASSSGQETARILAGEAARRAPCALIEQNPTTCSSSTASDSLTESPPPLSGIFNATPLYTSRVANNAMLQTSFGLPLSEGKTDPRVSISKQELEHMIHDAVGTRRSVEIKVAIGLLVTAIIIMLTAFVSAIIFGFHVMHQRTKLQAAEPFRMSSSPGGRSPDLSEAFDQQSQYGHPQYVELRDLNRLPLQHIQQMQSLTLQWGRPGSGTERQYFYQILSAMRDARANTTTLNLSSDYRLVTSNTSAVLFDGDQKEVGILLFSAAGDEGTEEEEDEDSRNGVAGDAAGEEGSRAAESEQSVDSDDERQTGNSEAYLGRKDRRLGPLLGGKKKKNKRFGKYPRNSEVGNPEDMFDAYCRYGCGRMAVTFPYYYRPFFGYGFPLVGTEAMFPQGYGGSPATEILARQQQVAALQQRGQQQQTATAVASATQMA